MDDRTVNISFGQRLKEARQNAGFDIETLARRLHIRSDIIKSIEDSDFSNMPASGYARNMIRAYARTVCLNPNEICNQYMEELQNASVNKQTELNRQHISKSEQNKDRQRSIDNHSSQRRGTAKRCSEGRDSNVARQQRRRNTSQKTTSSMSSSFSLGSLPKPSVAKFSSLNIAAIASIAIIVILVIIISIVLLTPKKPALDDVPAMPISGFSDTSNQDSGGNNENDNSKSTNTSKTTFEFSVDSGAKSYILIEIDGKQEYSEVATGPITKSFDVTKTLVFSTANPDPVKCSINGEQVKLTQDQTTGYYKYTVDVSNTTTSKSTNSNNANQSSVITN